MKRTIFLYFAFLGIFLWGCNQAEPADSVGSESVDPALFSEIMAASATDWNNGNLDGHLFIYDSAATFMTATGLIGVNKLKENFQKKYFNESKPVQQLAFDQIKVKPLGDAYALITGKFILTGGNQPEQSGRFSLVFGKSRAGWKVLHDHSS